MLGQVSLSDTDQASSPIIPQTWESRPPNLSFRSRVQAPNLFPQTQCPCPQPPP